MKLVTNVNNLLSVSTQLKTMPYYLTVVIIVTSLYVDMECTE